MEIVPHPRKTRSFGPPPDWLPDQHGECGTLEIADVATASGNFMESWWKPEPEELQALNNGGAIVLGIRGAIHPVVYLVVTNAGGNSEPATAPAVGEGQGA